MRIPVVLILLFGSSLGLLSQVKCQFCSKERVVNDAMRLLYLLDDSEGYSRLYDLVINRDSLVYRSMDHRIATIMLSRSDRHSDAVNHCLKYLRGGGELDEFLFETDEGFAEIFRNEALPNLYAFVNENKIISLGRRSKIQFLNDAFDVLAEWETSSIVSDSTLADLRSAVLSEAVTFIDSRVTYKYADYLDFVRVLASCDLANLENFEQSGTLRFYESRGLLRMEDYRDIFLDKSGASQSRCETESFDNGCIETLPNRLSPNRVERCLRSGQNFTPSDLSLIRNELHKVLSTCLDNF